MTKMFKTPFAAQGDRVAVPVESQADGSVSYTQGYGYDYERDQAIDPAAKDIEREKMNALFHDVTEAVGEIQTFGTANWSADGKPYPICSQVYYGKKLWQSKIENNNDEPGKGSSWTELKAGVTASDVGAYSKEESDLRFQPKGNYQAAGYSYSKLESDSGYQPKGNYALRGESYTKVEGDGRYQAKGNYTPSGYSYSKAESEARYQPKNGALTINAVYPVGIVAWFAQNKDPNTLFPSTTWKYIGENRTIRLASANGSDVMTTGGSDSVTIAVGNLPAHAHAFSANTNSFDYGTKTTSSFDYGNKNTNSFDYGTKTTNSTGDHAHGYIDTRTSGDSNGVKVAGSTGGAATNKSISSTTNAAGAHAHTVWIGAHAHTVTIGAHTHTVGIGAHSHSVSGTTSNTGAGTALGITNSFIKLMGWYRIA